jgi:hypothetical protein
MEAALPASPGTRSPLDESTTESHAAEVAGLISGPAQTPERTTSDTLLDVFSPPMNQTLDAVPSRLSSEALENSNPTEEEKNEQQVAQELIGGIDEEDEQDDGEEDDSGERNTDEADDNVEYMPNGASFLHAPFLLRVTLGYH